MPDQRLSHGDPLLQETVTRKACCRWKVLVLPNLLLGLGFVVFLRVSSTYGGNVQHLQAQKPAINLVDPAQIQHFAHLLQQTVAFDPQSIQAATAQLQAGENDPNFILVLLAVIQSTEIDGAVRQAGALYLKNFYIKRHGVSKLTRETVDQIKSNIVSVLSRKESDVGKAVGQVVAKIGAIEVPNGNWPELVPLLLQFVTSGDLNAKTIALTTLGYLCEELDILQDAGLQIQEDQFNQILTAVVQGTREIDLNVKLQATKALYFALVLAQKNFENENERSFIMQVVQEGCQSADSKELQIAALECLIQIGAFYYRYLPQYMNTIAPLTFDVIKGDQEDLAVLALEFWSTVCDEELFLDSDGAAGTNKKGQTNVNMIKQAAPVLLPLLTEMLTKKDLDDEEEDEPGNLPDAAGQCLSKVAQVVKDDCIESVMGFVMVNIANPDWRYREAAQMAFGCLMEGPSDAKMAPFVQQSFSHLVAALTDQSIAVRDTIAWTISRIAQNHWSIIGLLVQQLMPVLLEKLQDDPRISAKICRVIVSLAEAESESESHVTETTPFSAFFPTTVQALLETAARPDADQRQLWSTAYNSLAHFVSAAGNDCLEQMQTVLREILTRLRNSYGHLGRDCELQGALCGVLQTLTQRLELNILPAADELMQEYLKVFEAYRQVKGGAPVVHEDALLAMSALINSLEDQFASRVSVALPWIITGLQGFKDASACLSAVGAVSDLCNALQAQVLPVIESCMPILCQHLQDPDVDRKIKAAIMTCYGDIALAIGGDFDKFLVPAVQTMQQASMTRVEDGPPGDEDWVDFLNSLRASVFDAYTGIILGLKDAGKVQMFKDHVDPVLDFVRRICDDQSVSDAVLKSAVAVIGDLIMVFQTELCLYLKDVPLLPRLMHFASMSQDQSLQEQLQRLQSLLGAYQAQT